MLILAGVSLNALVGDNGIISNAQNAKVLNGMAVLEEFLQEKYVEHFEEIENGEENKAAILQGLHPEYFCSSNLGYIPDANGNALYLINKDGLPEEIKSQLVGGEAGEKTYIDYMNLNNVYGVTSRLKVYYCQNGLETMIGAVEDDLDKDNPNRVVVSSSSPMNSAINMYDSDGDGNLSSREVKRIKNLTIENKMDIKTLSDLSGLSSLESLTLKDMNLDNLNGLERCGRLNYIFFENVICSDYSNLKSLSEIIKYLYFYNLDDVEFDKICEGMKEKDFNKLNYLAFVGNKRYINSTELLVTNGKTSKLITNIDSISKLTDKTKETVKYLSLQNNNIERIDGIEKFTSLYLLRLEYNNLTSVQKLDNNKSLVYLYLSYNPLLINIPNFGQESKLAYIFCNDSSITTLSGLKKCSNIFRIEAYNCKLGLSLENSLEKKDTDSIKSLQGKSQLKYVNLENNSNLLWVEYLSNCISIRTLLLDKCNNMDSVSLGKLKNIFNNCTSFSYPKEYALALLDDSVKRYNLKDLTITSNEFRGLKDKTSLELLSLCNLKLVNKNLDGSETILSQVEINKLFNEVLSTLTNIKYLQIYADNNTYNISTVSTLDFVGSGKITKLLELDLRGTSIIDLSNLNEGAESLQTLIINNENIDLVGMQDCINNIFYNNYDGEKENIVLRRSVILGENKYFRFGLIILNSDLFRKIEKLEKIVGFVVGYQSFRLDFDIDFLDLSKCNSLKKIGGYGLVDGVEKIKFPDCIEFLSMNYWLLKEYDFSNCIKLNEISFSASSFSGLKGERLINTIKSMSALENLSLIKIEETRER